MMLEVQKYLMDRSLSDLKEERAIDFRVQDHKAILNYNQINAKSGDPIVEECRGLILRKKDKAAINPLLPLGDSKVMSMAFRRFYNWGDPACAKIDWESAVIQEKLDGSLIALYYDDVKEEWHASTRKRPEADLNLNGFDFTFRQLFERALHDTLGLSFKEFTNKLSWSMTYSFELCTPFNKIIVNHQDCKIYSLGMRTISDLKEWEPFAFNEPPVPKPRTWTFSNPDEIIAFVNEQDPTQQEGVVIVDKHFNRAKIKSLSYTTFNKLHDSLSNSPKNCLTFILEGKDDDVYPYMPPPIQKLMTDIKGKTGTYLSKFESQFAEALEFAGKDDPKLFADKVSRMAAVDNSVWTAPMFSIYRGQAKSLVDWMNRNKRLGKYNSNNLDHFLEKIK